MSLFLSDEVDQLLEWFYDQYGTKEYRLDVLYNHSFKNSREEMLVQISSKDRKILGAMPMFITDQMRVDKKYVEKTKATFLPAMQSAIAKYIANQRFQA